MVSNIKIVRDFQSVDDIDRIIENWADRSGFKENTLPVQLNMDDVAYCFSLDDGNSKVLLTINILDDKVHLEAWTVENISEKKLPRAAINGLLKILGQDLMER